jgi:hypothetical protein
VPFTVDDTLTVSLGPSGYEQVTVEVHDASTVPVIFNGGHGSAWLQPATPSAFSNAFVRFEWRDAMVAATGLSASYQIADARFRLRPDFGAAQTSPPAAHCRPGGTTAEATSRSAIPSIR